MKRAPAEDIVRFLSFSSESSAAATAIEAFTTREWNRVLQWMEDAGLAFFFLRKLMDSRATRLVPAPVLSRLQRNFALNQTRVGDISRHFWSINQRFDNAGVRYAVVKGFSLVPEFCPAATLRHQADIDYLIDPQSLSAARRVLLDSGYEAQDSVSDKESIFVTPGAEPSRNDSQYSSQAGHAVELHTDVWDNEMHGLQRIPHFFSLDQARTRHWDGLTFLSLSDEDTFLLQVLHACHHLFTQWIRMSCLFEIGYFLNRRALDVDLWGAVACRVQDNLIVREFAVIVAELVAQLFAAPVPPEIQDWAGSIRPATRVWIENYARKWAFCELPVHELSWFPRSKLVLFLQQQYRAEPVGSLPDPRDSAKEPPLSNVAQPARRTLRLLITNWRKRKRFLRRGIYYTLAQARYLCEIPRWIWLNRAIPSASVGSYLPISKKPL